MNTRFTIGIRTLLIAVLATFSLVMVACSDDAEPNPGDNENESFLAEGKSDQLGGIEEGSLRAQGILLLVNTMTFEELDALLDVRAARSITGFRSGPDGVLGTSDDRVIYTLAVLDGLSWVGPRALNRLYDTMLENDLIPDTTNLVHGIKEGSSAAIGMLVVVNSLNFDELNTFLDVRAVRGIVAYRDQGVIQGKRMFRSLAQLDTVSYMGASAFSRLRGFAEDNGFIEFPEDPSEDVELSLQPGNATGEVEELAYVYEASSERRSKKWVNVYEVSAKASTSAVGAAVRDYHEHEESIDQIYALEREEFLSQRFINREFVNAVEATYGTDYTIAELSGNFVDNGWGEWWIEIAVFYFEGQDLAVVLTDTFSWE